MTDFEAELDEEYRLAVLLRDNYCNKSGKETNPAKAGEILHKIGQVYRKRSPDKISIIKSAGLFNAAIARNPSNNAQIKSDLSEICQHILQQAKANKQNADLFEKAEEIKTSFRELRKQVKDFLSSSVPEISEKGKHKVLNKLKTNKISAIQQINKTIAKRYEHIMADLALFCQNVMGKPPCEYAIMGMGSLSRQEITPYSDFEHVILLFDDKNYKSYLEYFRWYSVIFHVIILNLQETIVPSLNISSLNGKDSNLGDWYYDSITSRGVSFDGMMPHACKFPLGRQQCTKSKNFTTELIKPISEMLEYLSSDVDLKNGYHLADILTKTSFVFGNVDIFKQFEEGALKYRNGKSQKDTITNIQEQVKEDLNSFSTRFRLTKLKTQNQINIKQLVYRSTTLFISALARIHNISANSSFDIINEMAKNSQISQYSADALQYAIAIACEMRLRVYAGKSSQCDNIIDLKQDSKNIRKFLGIVGVASTINYFRIAYCLQCEVAKQLNLTKLHFYSQPQLINITIALALGRKEVSKISLQKIGFWNKTEFDFETCIKQIQTEQSNWSLIKRITLKRRLKRKQTTFIANSLYSAGAYDEALDFYKELLQIYENKPKNDNRDEVVASINHDIGSTLLHLGQYKDANTHLMRAIQLQQDLTFDPVSNFNLATMLNDVGSCKVYLHQYGDALNYLKQALEITQTISDVVATDRHVASILNEIALCLMHLQRDEALYHFNCSVEIYKRASVDLAKDKNLGAALNNIGYYLMYQQRYGDALDYLNQAYEICLNTQMDGAEKNLELAATQSNIGRCLMGLQQYDESWKYLQQSLEIKQNSTLDEAKDKRIAYNYNYMGEWSMKKQQFVDALNYFQRALEIYKKITTDMEKDEVLANTLDNTGQCTMQLQQYDNALPHLKNSLKIYLNLPQSQRIKSIIEAIRSNIDQCLLKHE